MEMWALARAGVARKEVHGSEGGRTGGSLLFPQLRGGLRSALFLRYLANNRMSRGVTI